MKNRFYVFLSFCMLGWPGACKKYLAKTPNESLAPPSTVAGYRSLLDNDVITGNSTPGLGPLAVADYTVTFATWQNADLVSKGVYNWQPQVYQGTTDLSWSRPYQAIYICNAVLNGMPSLPITSNAEQQEYNAVYGTALFDRAFMFYHLEETFGQPYNPSSAISDPGIPLRLGVDPLQPVSRSSVQAVFGRITHDLLQAAPLLPAGLQDTNRNRPCRSAALALLARVYLTQQRYAVAKLYADSSLLLYNKLVNFNTVNSASSHPFPMAGNIEVLFQCSAFNYPMQYSTSSQIDSLLYNSYDSNDLRKVVFFRKTSDGAGFYFKGSYTGTIYLFSGIATDEIFFIRAECNARTGELDSALKDLNAVLFNRWRTGTFQPYTAETADEALWLVLKEKRKETLFREVRWSDLRRLNQDPLHADTLRRVLGTNVYTLLPGDPHYTFKIPETEVQLSGLLQNPG